ncbi:polysaccharide pyruvyl transferase family protein [Ochrobactrum sp. CM-21-5]|nr:polysaccharide pyruvyl transferase family protein [Ochrobactrum sp. CM-21-5]
MRIGLFGQFGSGNTGNDGSLEAMLKVLNRICPEAHIVCICSGPQIIQETLHIDARSIGRPSLSNPILRTIDQAFMRMPRRLGDFIRAVSIAYGLDLMIIPGTGILDDFNEDPFGWPFAILRWCVAARMGGAQLVFVSIGAGPIVHPLSQIFMKKAARLASFRSFRDKVSHDFMHSMNVDVSADPVSADIAFSLPAVREEEGQNGRERIGLGVMVYKGWKKQDQNASAIYETYLDRMTEIMDKLLQSGRQVRLLSGDKSDQQALDDLLARIRPGRGDEVIVEPVTSLHDLMKQIAKTDIVVASRYHNIVCALRMGRPAISLGYARKNDVLLQDTGLGLFCHHVETFEPARVLDQVDELFVHRERFVQKIKIGVDDYLRRLAEQEQRLKETVLSYRRKGSRDFNIRQFVSQERGKDD